MNKLNLAVTAVVFLTLTSPLAFSQGEQQTRVQADEELSYGRPNGNYYLALYPQERRDFLYGVEQGIALLADEKLIPQAIMQSYTIRGFSFDYLALQIDGLYANKDNIRIPVAYGYLYAIRKSRGDSPKEIESFLAELRKRFQKR